MQSISFSEFYSLSGAILPLTKTIIISGTWFKA